MNHTRILGPCLLSALAGCSVAGRGSEPEPTAAPAILVGEAALERLSADRRALLRQLTGGGSAHLAVDAETGAVLLLSLSRDDGARVTGPTPEQFVHGYVRLLDPRLAPGELVAQPPDEACGGGTAVYLRALGGVDVLGSRLLFRLDSGRVRQVENLVAPAVAPAGVMAGFNAAAPDEPPGDGAEARSVLVPMAGPGGRRLHPGRLVYWAEQDRVPRVAVEVTGAGRVMPALAGGEFNPVRPGLPRYHPGPGTGIPDYITYAPVGGVRVEALSGEVNPVEAVYRYLEAHPSVFRTGAARCQFEAAGVQESGTAGTRLVRMRQRYLGLPVFGAELVFEVRGLDRIYSVAGHTLPLILVDPRPRIGRADAHARALALAREALRRAPAGFLPGADSALWLARPEVELGVFPGPLVPRRVLPTVLAYRVSLPAFIYFIDAVTGEAVYAVSTRQGQDQLVNDGHGRSEWARGSFTTMVRNGAVVAPGPLNPDIFGSPALGGAVGALRTTAATFAAHGWRGVNGTGRAFVANTNVALASSPCPNAFFLTVLLHEAFFCLGTARPDVVAHEFTHGVLASSSGLVYMDEPGALNESFADIIGSLFFPDVVVPPATRPGWLHGEAAGGTTRNLAIPFVASYAAYADRTTTPPGEAGGCDILPWSCDSGWVHFNSGINSLAYVLLIDGTNLPPPAAVIPITAGIGRLKGRTLAFLTMTGRLTPWARMLDALHGTMAACATLRDAGAFPAALPAEVAAATPFTSADCDQIPIVYAQVGLEADLVSGWAAPTLGFSGTDVVFPGESTDNGCTVVNVLSRLRTPSGIQTATAAPPAGASWFGIFRTSIVPPAPIGSTSKTHSVRWFSIFGVRPAHFSVVVAPPPPGAPNCVTPAGRVPVTRETRPPVEHGWNMFAQRGTDVVGPAASAMSPACVLRGTKVEIVDAAGTTLAGPVPSAEHHVDLFWIFGFPVQARLRATIVAAPAGPPDLSTTVSWMKGGFTDIRYRVSYSIDQPIGTDCQL